MSGRLAGILLLFVFLTCLPGPSSLATPPATQPGTADEAPPVPEAHPAGTFSLSRLAAPLRDAPWEYVAAALAALSAASVAAYPRTRRVPARAADAGGRAGKEMRAILSALDSMVLELDRDGCLLRVLKAASGPEGFDPQRHVGANISSFLGTGDLAAVRGALSRAGAERTTQRVEFTTGEGEARRFFAATLSPMRGASIMTVIRDVTTARASQEKYRELVELANCVILRLDRRGRITFANEYALRFFGYSKEELQGRAALGTIVPPTESTGRDLGGLLRDICRRPESIPAGENENIRKNGERVWVSWSNRPITENGVLTGVLCVGSDVTRQRRIMEELVRRERFHGSIIEKSTDVITILDQGGRILHESPAAARHLGYPVEEVAGTMLGEHIHPEDREMFAGILKTVLANPGDNPAFTFRRIRRDGSLAHLEATATNCLDDDAVSGIIVNCRDVTERAAFEEQLRRHVFLDALTGLPNRALFLDRLSHAIERLRRKSGYQFAVLFVDLDRFKLVNDSLGHSVGDRLLARIGRRLSSCLRRVDTVARFGGDEFILLLDEIDDDRQAIRVAERIREELARPFVMDEAEVFASASIGIVFSSPDYTDPDQIIRDADTAMFKAKARGKGGYRVFHSRMHTQAVSLLALETDLRRAVDRGEFELHYQPILSLETIRMVGVEALVRWRHPERGLVAPMEFIPMAEETGLIVPIGAFVLAEACRRVGEHNAASAARDSLFVSVNLSARQFERDSLAEDIRDILGRTGLSPGQLKLEVTESAIAVNPDQAALLLKDLRDLGVGLSMDDFGTGYSCLSHLHALPFDTLKIDRSFVSGLGHNGDKNGKIVHSIMALARNLDMSVIAEGIETDAQLNRLVAMQCRFGQGYRFARPAPFDELPGLETTPAGEPAFLSRIPEPSSRESRP